MMSGAAATVGGGLGGARRLRPAPADAFAASVGLCVHLASAAYAGMFNDVLRWARELGVRHFRDDLRPTDDLARWRALFDDAGVRAHLLVSPSTNTPSEMMAYVHALGPRLVSAIEGQNEGDGPWFRAQPSARPNWAAAVTRYQQTIYSALRSEYSAATLPILSPTVLDYRPGDMKTIRQAAPYCDIVALHAYVQAEQAPETSEAYAALSWYVREMRDPFKPGAPIMVTETGYRTGPSGISPRANGIYLPRLLLNNFDQDVRRTFIYELLDEGVNERDSEQNYGLVRLDGRPKPAYFALRALMRTLSDPGPTFAPSPLGYKISRAPPDLRCCVFGKRDGTSVLALWRAMPVWDPASGRDVALEPIEVQIDLDRSRIGASSEIGPDLAWQRHERTTQLAIPVSGVVTLVVLAS